jgi:hypothetical protein
MMSALVAGYVKMGPGEEQNLGISFEKRLQTGELIQAPATATLIDQNTGQHYPEGLIESPPSIVSPTVTQIIGGLIEGHRYTLDIVVGSNQSQKFEGQIIITCERRV